MKKIKLDSGVEEPILNTILTTPDRIVFIPSDMYNKIEKYLIQEERYEDIKKLTLIKHKINDEINMFEEGEELFVGITQKICDN